MLVPEVEAPGPHREDAHLQASNAWDAWDDARRDATAAADLRREPSDAGAEKLAVPALDARARDALSLPAHRPARRAPPDAVAELCTPDAVPSAEQSCVAREAAADPSPLALWDAAEPLEHEARSTPRPQALLAEEAQPLRLERAASRDAPVPQPEARLQQRSE